MVTRIRVLSNAAVGGIRVSGRPGHMRGQPRLGSGAVTEPASTPDTNRSLAEVSEERGTPEARRSGKVVQYKGAPLEASKGPGLGCFWSQVAALVIAIVLTPVSAAWNWPLPITIFLLATMLVLLLFVGQTAIFLMRLVAADRRAAGRRRPLDSATRTVGELEDAQTQDETETESAEERHVHPPETPGGGVRE
jgi:hypothetical protein